MEKYNCRHFTETSSERLLHQAGDVILVAGNVNEVPYQSLQMGLPSAEFLFTFELQRSMATKNKTALLKTIILGNKMHA